MTTKKAEFVCPECNKAFEFAKTLGSHRRLTHGIAGTSASAIRAQKLKALAPPEPTSYRCPDCDFVAKANAGLTIHRKAKHGAASMSRTAVAIRASDPLQCPECEFHAHNPGGLALHRLKQHGVVSERRSTELRRLQQRFDAKKRGLPIEPAQTVTAVAVTSTSNGHHPQESHFVGNGIPQATLALALGRVQELCRSIATEHDLPPRSFAAELARLIHATTLR